MTPLLDPDEPPPVTVHGEGGPSPFLLTCDHASRRIPRRLERLGVADADLGRHIGWDIGALDVARTVSDRLGATLFAAGYSRLVIDLNRPAAAPDLIPPVSDGTRIPGNETVPAGQREARVAELFCPYHARIAAEIDRRQEQRRPTLLACIHSFTPRMNGLDRPWHIGVCYGAHDRLARPLIAALRQDPAIVVGDNEPYRVDRASDYGVPVHGEDRGIPAVLIEIRQDLIADTPSARQWGERLARSLAAVEPFLLDQGAEH